MSGKELPLNFGKNAASICISQLAKTSIITPTMYASRWCNQPGFLDPFEVVYLCIGRLKQATYINVRYCRRNDAKSADKSHLCPGLEVYLKAFRQDEQVQQDLAEYISHGSLTHLRYVIRKYSLDQVMAFLLKYIRERGHLLRIHYSSLIHLQQACSHSSTLAIAFLTGGHQHEFEYESMVAIGSYLSYLLTVACAHDLFWMQGFLAELWGPLLIDFVNIGEQLSESMTKEQLNERRICFMSRLLDSMPWDTLKRCESLRLTLGPDQDRQEMLRHGMETNRRTAQLQERPPTLTATLMGKAPNICAFLDGQAPEPTQTTRDLNVQYVETINEKLLKEDMLQQKKKKNREDNAAAGADFSDQYVYTEKYRVTHAPQGMLQKGS